jgi:fatty-acyl-CoA synthase
VPDPDFGQRPAAVVILKDGDATTDDEFQVYARAQLARYKIPREIVFVERLPRTSTCKIQRRKLAEQFETERH